MDYHNICFSIIIGVPISSVQLLSPFSVRSSCSLLISSISLGQKYLVDLSWKDYLIDICIGPFQLIMIISHSYRSRDSGDKNHFPPF